MYRVREDYPSTRCKATHDPGMWPNIARCIWRKAVAHTRHEDHNGRTWRDEK